MININQILNFITRPHQVDGKRKNENNKTLKSGSIISCFGMKMTILIVPCHNWNGTKAGMPPEKYKKSLKIVRLGGLQCRDNIYSYSHLVSFPSTLTTEKKS